MFVNLLIIFVLVVLPFQRIVLLIGRVEPLTLESQCLFYNVAHTPLAAWADGYVVADFFNLGGGIGRAGGHAAVAHHLIVGYVVAHADHLRLLELVSG